MSTPAPKNASARTNEEKKLREPGHPGEIVSQLPFVIATDLLERSDLLFFSMHCEIASIAPLSRNDVITQSLMGEGRGEDGYLLQD